ncbi:MAG: hypothetical protein F4124_05985 [Acidimicrobiia bacterium]|nr:hypothetical protein [Acidimicrobiia bacterium]MYB10773.1 hypothetical protein [Acidimicrobiia bacterium]MYB73211.1 hypothetical protein [Acidimicrobiia bacterium]MYG57052.1 hypothetical protein [Acidimicrobiia bacterium]MYH98957.1 hypothetical protein [Acidimicrobiia bacterium]
MRGVNWKDAWPWLVVAALALGSNPYYLAGGLGFVLLVRLYFAAKNRWGLKVRMDWLGRLWTWPAKASMLGIGEWLHFTGVQSDDSVRELAGLALMLPHLVPLVRQMTKPYRDDRQRRLPPDHGFHGERP